MPRSLRHQFLHQTKKVGARGEACRRKGLDAFRARIAFVDSARVREDRPELIVSEAGCGRKICRLVPNVAVGDRFRAITIESPPSSPEILERRVGCDFWNAFQCDAVIPLIEQRPKRDDEGEKHAGTKRDKELQVLVGRFNDGRAFRVLAFEQPPDFVEEPRLYERMPKVLPGMREVQWFRFLACTHREALRLQGGDRRQRRRMRLAGSRERIVAILLSAASNSD